jgi:hypothetical protein
MIRIHPCDYWAVKVVYALSGGLWSYSANVSVHLERIFPGAKQDDSISLTTPAFPFTCPCSYYHRNYSQRTFGLFLDPSGQRIVIGQ